MIGRAQLIMCLLAVICVSMVTSKGKECGDNPMKQVLLVAKRTGRTLDRVLTVLRDIDAPAYETLARRFRMYAACVGLVDTGYFRKRTDPAMASHEIVPELSYRSSLALGHSAEKRFAILAELPSQLMKDVNEQLLDGGNSLYTGQHNIPRNTYQNTQLVDDANDISRSILSLFTKAKQIMEIEQLAHDSLRPLRDDTKHVSSDDYQDMDPFVNIYRK